MLKGKEKAAAILSILGEEMSQRILSFLPEQEAISIISASETLETPTKDTLEEIISEFNGYMSDPEITVAASQEKAAEKGKPLQTGTPAEIIDSADPKRLAAILQEERTEIAAYVLSHLSVEKIYEILQMLGPSRQNIESKLITIKDVPMAKEIEQKILKSVAEKLV